MSVIRWAKRWKMVLTAGTVFLFLSLLLQPEKASGSIIHAMENYCTRLIPVLFPYMVLSHFFCTYGMLQPLAFLLPVNRLFRMGRDAVPVFLMGHLCGYPIGAGMTGTLVRSEKLNRRQGEILCAIASGASPAFLLHAVGGYLWHSVPFGGFLLVLQILAGLAAGAILCRRSEAAPAAPDVMGENIPFSQCFCEAVGGSAVKIVSIGGYIVFFSLLTDMLPGSMLFRSVSAAVLEFSSGARMAASVGGKAGLFLTGFSAGFGGLSVLAQNAHMLAGTGIRLHIYLLYKIFLGFFCGTGCLLYGFLFPEMQAFRNVSASLYPADSQLYLYLFFVLLGMMWYTWYAYRESRQ